MTLDEALEAVNERSQAALAALTKATHSVLACIAGGDDPLSTIAGALLETFVLGALVGEGSE